MLSLKTGHKAGINLHKSMFYLFASVQVLSNTFCFFLDAAANTETVFSWTCVQQIQVHSLSRLVSVNSDDSTHPFQCFDILEHTAPKKSLQKVFLFPLVFMTLPDTLWFTSDSTCKLSQRVSGLFQHRKKIHFYKKKKDNENPWWDSNFTLACLKVWEEAAKRHSRRQNSQQANVQIKKWEIRNTNVQRIGWNRLWNWVLNREKGPQNAPKHWRAAASGTAITRSPVWDGTEEIRKTTHHWSKRNV